MPKAATKAPPVLVDRSPVLGEGDIPPEEFGRRLRAAREAAGWTRGSDAAAALGMTRQTFHDLESGRGSPGLSRVVTIARVLGLDPAILVPEWFQKPKGR